MMYPDIETRLAAVETLIVGLIANDPQGAAELKDGLEEAAKLSLEGEDDRTRAVQARVLWLVKSALAEPD